MEVSPELIDSGIVFIAGAVASVLTSVVNRPWWTTQKRQYASLIVSLICGIAASVLKGLIAPPPVEPTAFVAWVIVNLGIVSGISQVVYMQFSEKLKALEVNTSPAQLPEQTN